MKLWEPRLLSSAAPSAVRRLCPPNIASSKSCNSARTSFACFWDYVNKRRLGVVWLLVGLLGPLGGSVAAAPSRGVLCYSVWPAESSTRLLMLVPKWTVLSHWHLWPNTCKPRRVSEVAKLFVFSDTFLGKIMNWRCYFVCVGLFIIISTSELKDFFKIISNYYKYTFFFLCFWVFLSWWSGESNPEHPFALHCTD